MSAGEPLSRVPLAGLSPESRQLISTLLNPPKVIPASTGLPRDWRGLAQLCSLGGELLPAIATDPDPTNRILAIVQKRPEEFTLLSLRDALEKLERWDIVDDSQELLVRDAEVYLERLQRSESSALQNDFAAEKDVLTIDDLFRKERGEQTQHYDAFLLYADEDTDFALEMVEHLETQNNLKICLKDRDLVAGLSFEHEAIIRLISERCNRLITILSPEFLESPANKFFVNFAQANSIADKQQERKIIPCVYKNCELPPQLTYYSKIYYKKLSPDFFWNKLLCSMKVVPSSVKNSTEKVPKKTEQNGLAKVVNPETVNEPAAQESLSTQNGTESAEKSSSLGIRLTGSTSFPFIKRKRREQQPTAPEPSTSSEGQASEDPILNLPSVADMDSLSSVSLSESTEPIENNRSKKKKKKFMEKARALIAK